MDIIEWRTMKGLLKIILYLVGLQNLSVVRGNCTFPVWLYKTFNNQPKVWVTKTRFHMKSTSWGSRREISVSATEIIAKSLYRRQCPNRECFHGELEYRQNCYKRIYTNTFIVSQIKREQVSYLCIKFEKRSDTVLQIWKASGITHSDPRICQDRNLKRDEWPWISNDIVDKAIECPMYGGYDFRAYEGPRRRKICPDSWRSFRMESQCMPGDGIQFIFPQGCNFLFSDYRSRHSTGETNVTLYCYAHWTEDNYRFLLLGTGIGDNAQYIMRLPDDSELEVRQFATEQPEMLGNFNAEFYFNPIAPISDLGAPPGNVVVVDLRLHRTGRQYCADETDMCDSQPAKDYCRNYDQSNYCKKTCGICATMPSTVLECHFPQETRRDWVIFDGNRMQDVKVGTGVIILPNMGNLTCKTNFPGKPHHKLLVLFNNGCRPRYTCMKINETRHNLIEFKIAKGHRIDKSEDMCYFHDISPVHPKGMPTQLGFAKEYVDRGTCGLNGYIRVTVQNDNQRCMGYIGDWDPVKCQRDNKITLNVPNCYIVKQHIQEFKCIAYIHLSQQRSVLITQPLDNNSGYNCWAITTKSVQYHYKPWKHLRLLTRSPCGKDMDFSDKSSLRVQVLRSNPERPCGPARYTLYNYAQSTTWSYNKPNRQQGLASSGRSGNSGITTSILYLILSLYLLTS